MHGSDYEYSLLGLPEGSTEYSKVKHEVHLRSARKLQDLCFKNGGIYIKLGQHIGQLVWPILSSINEQKANWICSCDGLIALAWASVVDL